MALRITETDSYTVGGSNGKRNIVREVTITADAAGDLADGVVITASALRFGQALRASSLANSAGEIIQLFPKYDRTGFIVKKVGTFTPTQLTFIGCAEGI